MVMESKGLANNVAVGAVKQMVSTTSAPAALGINDLSSISNYVTAASQLGLQDNSKIAAFMKVANTVGGLAPGAATIKSAESCISGAVMKGIMPPNSVAAGHAVSLLNNAKNLGMTPTNMERKITEIAAQAEKFGIKPRKSAEEHSEANAADGQAITCHKLKFVPIDFTNILEANVKQNINEHGRLYLKGVLKPVSGGEAGSAPPEDQIIQETDVGTAVALYNVEENGKVETLFQGLVINIKQTQTADLTYIEVEALSPSYNLDIQKKSRSFQRTSATYNDIIETVNAGQGEIKNNGTNKATGKLIVQYKETDWCFLKRMASHQNTGLVPIVTTEKIQIHFGVPKGEQAKTITASAYSVKKRIGEFRTTQANDITHSQPNIRDADFTCYYVQTLDRLNIGDCVKFLNHTLYVRSINTSLEQGALKYYYELVSEAGLLQKDMFNPALAGKSLMAQVKSITKDQIKAHIVEIDAEWDSNGDWLLPYSTVFSSPDGSGWYAMPEPGDTVRVYFPTHKDEEAIAASSVNRDQSAQSQSQTASGGGDAPRTNPDNKSFSNKHGKEVLFTPGGIYITNQAGRIFINLTDDKGISIVSAKDISFSAKQNIILNAEQNIIMNANEKFSMTCKGASVISDAPGIIEFKGEEVRTN